MKKRIKAISYELEIAIFRTTDSIEDCRHPEMISHVFDQKSSIQNRRDAIQKCRDYVEIFNHARKLGSEKFLTPEEAEKIGYKNFSSYMIDILIRHTYTPFERFSIFGSLCDSLEEQLSNVNDEYSIYRINKLKMGKEKTVRMKGEDFYMVDDTPLVFR